MLAHHPVRPVTPVGFDRPVTLPLDAPLAIRLHAALLASPSVLSIGLADPALEALERPLGLGQAGLALATARLDDGRRLSLVAIPSATWRCPTERNAVLSLKRSAAAIGRRVLLVPETALQREPFASNTLTLAGCLLVPVAPDDHVALAAALVENGGELTLGDAVECMERADDPVAAVLALAARRVVRVDLSEPLGPDTRVLEISRRSRRLPS